MQHYIMTYLAVGCIFTILFDMLLRYTGGQDRLTLSEFALSITFWPGVLAVFIVTSINGKQD